MTGEAGEQQNTGRRVRHVTSRQCSATLWNTYVNQNRFWQMQHGPFTCYSDPWSWTAEHRRSSWHRQAACACSAWRRWDCQRPHSQHQVFSSSRSPTIAATFLVSNQAAKITHKRHFNSHNPGKTDILNQHQSIQASSRDVQKLCIMRCFRLYPAHTH